MLFHPLWAIKQTSPRRHVAYFQWIIGQFRDYAALGCCGVDVVVDGYLFAGGVFGIAVEKCLGLNPDNNNVKK